MIDRIALVEAVSCGKVMTKQAVKVLNSKWLMAVYDTLRSILDDILLFNVVDNNGNDVESELFGL